MNFLVFNLPISCVKATNRSQILSDFAATLSNTVQVGGSITASSRSGRVAFYADRKTKHYALSTIPRGTSDSYISQGTDVDPSVINDLTTINSLIDIDTATTGDTNGSGYIFRYNNDNSRIIVSKAN